MVIEYEFLPQILVYRDDMVLPSGQLAPTREESVARFLCRLRALRAKWEYLNHMHSVH